MANKPGEVLRPMPTSTSMSSFWKPLCLIAVAFWAAPVALAEEGGTTPVAFGRVVLELLSRADLAALSASLCDAEGLEFSAYSRGQDRLIRVRLTRLELISFTTTADERVWGRYDGSGAPILLTPMAYYRSFIYDRDYLGRAVRAHLGNAKLKSDAEWSGLMAAYPDADAISYRFEGRPEVDFKDARELVIVLGRTASGWCLEALSHNEDTI